MGFRLAFSEKKMPFFSCEFASADCDLTFSHDETSTLFFAAAFSLANSASADCNLAFATSQSMRIDADCTQASKIPTKPLREFWDLWEFLLASAFSPGRMPGIFAAGMPQRMRC